MNRSDTEVDRKINQKFFFSKNFQKFLKISKISKNNQELTFYQNFFYLKKKITKIHFINFHKRDFHKEKCIIFLTKKKMETLTSSKMLKCKKCFNFLIMITSDQKELRQTFNFLLSESGIIFLNFVILTLKIKNRDKFKK